MGVSIDNNINEKVYSYYLFQKKIECILNLKTNPFFKLKGEDIKSEKFYVINQRKVQEWKENFGYSVAKYYLDQIKIKDIKNYINDIKKLCKHLKEEQVIQNYNLEINDNDNQYSYCRFISKIILESEEFEHLIDEKTFKLFNNEISLFNKSYLIKGIITDRMIIFFIKEHYMCKIIYIREFNGNNELIHLSVDCTVMKEDKMNQEKSEKNFEEFKKYIKLHVFNIIEEFESMNIIFSNETTFYYKDGYSVLIKNEILNFKDLGQAKQILNNDFNNVNIFRKIGLTNVGATCYMNATLQCLINVNSLTKYLMTRTVYNNIIENIKSCELISAYCEVLYNVCCNSNVTHSYEPLNFKKIISSKNPLFKGISANDSKDLINFLLEEMNHELSNLSSSEKNINFKKSKIVNQSNKILTYNNFKAEMIKNNDSKIARTFFFTIETQTTCKKCCILKYNYQVLYLIEFQLESVFNFCFSNNMNQINNNGQKYITLLQCFEQYKNPTYFTGENSLYCNTCKSQQEAKYITNIYSLPPTLIIVLNRGKGNSFKCYVNFPEELNLQQYVTCPQSLTRYQLRGVITHLGESGMSGHFIAYCKHRIDNNWYCYNDAIVSYCDDQRNGFRKGTPYILFYDSLNGNNNVLYEKNILQGNDNLNFKNCMFKSVDFINKNMLNINNNMPMIMDNMISMENNMLINEMFKMNNMNNSNMNIMNQRNMNNMSNINNCNINNINKSNININNFNNMNNKKKNQMNNSNYNLMNNSNINNMNNSNFNQINNSNFNQMNNSKFNQMNNSNFNQMNNNNNNNNLNYMNKSNLNNSKINNMNNNINNINMNNSNLNNSNMNNMNIINMNKINMNNNNINNSNIQNMNNNNMNNMSNSNMNNMYNSNMNNNNMTNMNRNNMNNSNKNNSNMNNSNMNYNNMNNSNMNNIKMNNMNNINSNNMNNSNLNNNNINNTNSNNINMNNMNNSNKNKNKMDNGNMNNNINNSNMNNSNMNKNNNSNMNNMNMNNSNMNISNMINNNMNFNKMNNMSNSNMNHINMNNMNISNMNNSKMNNISMNNSNMNNNNMNNNNMNNNNMNNNNMMNNNMMNINIMNYNMMNNMNNNMMNNNMMNINIMNKNMMNNNMMNNNLMNINIMNNMMNNNMMNINIMNNNMNSYKNNNVNSQENNNYDTIMEEKEEKDIFLTFTFKEKNEQVYMDVNYDEKFSDIIIKLKNKYQWMKDIQINKYLIKKKEIKDINKTIRELGLDNNYDITVL